MFSGASGGNDCVCALADLRDGLNRNYNAYRLYLQNYLNDYARHRPEIRHVNTSPSGALIVGTERGMLDEVLESLTSAVPQSRRAHCLDARRDQAHRAWGARGGLEAMAQGVEPLSRTVRARCEFRTALPGFPRDLAVSASGKLLRRHLLPLRTPRRPGERIRGPGSRDPLPGTPALRPRFAEPLTGAGSRIKPPARGGFISGRLCLFCAATIVRC